MIEMLLLRIGRRREMYKSLVMLLLASIPVLGATATVELREKIDAIVSRIFTPAQPGQQC